VVALAKKINSTKKRQQKPKGGKTQIQDHSDFGRNHFGEETNRVTKKSKKKKWSKSSLDSLNTFFSNPILSLSMFFFRGGGKDVS
jgi:hypothetical protein